MFIFAYRCVIKKDIMYSNNTMLACILDKRMPFKIMALF